MKEQNNKVERVSGWVVVFLGEPTGIYQLKEEATDHVAILKRASGRTAKIIPCTIAYKLPLKKK